MNNHYQTPQSRPYDQRHPPQYQQYSAPNPQQQSGRGNNPQGSGPSTHQYAMNGPTPNTQNIQNSHNQLFQQYANSQDPQYGKQAPQSSPNFQQNHPVYFPPPQPQVGLISPPQLHQERDHEDANRQSKGSNAMHQSNQGNENEVREILWGQQEQANTFWEQKFFLIYEKFEWFGSRFQMLKTQYTALGQQLITVDSQDDWNELKHHHEQFAQKLQEMLQELIAVADQNQQLINQRLEEDDGVWEKRYHELLSNFKSLQQKTSMLEVQNDEIKSSKHGDQAKQQQDYPELLSHYRNLEEEYEKLFNAYNKQQQEIDQLKSNADSKEGPSLEDFENMRMEYQRTLEAINNENDGLKSECQGFYEENQHFRQQLQAQAQQLAEVHHLSQQIQSKSAFIHSLNEELSDWRNKCQQLQMQYSNILSKQSKNIQQTSEKHEKQLQFLQQQLKSKESQYSSLSKRLNDEVRSREQLVEQHQEELEKAVRSQNEKQTRLRSAVEKQMKSLHDEYEALLHKSSQTDTSKYQVQGLKKRIGFLTEENEQLIKQITAKNQQLAALRNVSLQVATYENILEQYRALEKDKMVLEEVNRKQHNDLLQTKKRLSLVEHEFTEHRNINSSISLNSSTNAQLKQLQTQLQSQTSKASKLQSEVHKFKQLIEAKERYIHELQDESSKAVSKLQYQQRMMNGTKDDHQSQVMTLERRIQTLEKRTRSNETDFKKEMVHNYEREIKELRAANQDKLKKIKRTEETLQQLSIKSSHLQKHSSIYNSQQLLFHNKLVSLEKSNGELLSKLELSCSSIQALDHQLTSLKERQATLRSQVKNYTTQIEQADNLIKNKNNIIIEYEKQVQQFLQKVSALEDRIDGERMQKMQKIKKYESEIEKLKDRLYSPPAEERRDSLSGGYRYNSTYSTRYMSFGTKQPTQGQPRNEQIVKLESNLIEQMHEQNLKLRSQLVELTKKIHSLQSLSRVIPNMQQSQNKSQSKSRISKVVPERDVGLINGDVQERLLRFNQRLQNCIQDHELFSARDVDLTASQRIAMHEKDKRQTQIKFEKQIKELKDQIDSLQQQLANANSAREKLTDSDLKQFDKYHIINEHTEKSTQQELDFLRSRLNDQQKTNAALIQLNEKLKKQLQDSFQKGLHSTTEYYKLQWREAERSLQEQKQKTKRLQDQNNRLKHDNLEHDSKIIKEYELRFFNFEEQLSALQRQNTCLKMIKAKSDNEKANYQHDIHVYTADMEAIKASTNAKITHYQKITKELREKCNAMERELYQVNNKWGAMNGISRTFIGNQKPQINSSRRVLA